MEEEIKKKKQHQLEQLIEVPFFEEAAGGEVKTSKLDDLGRARATGRRKRASARPWA